MISSFCPLISDDSRIFQSLLQAQTASPRPLTTPGRGASAKKAIPKRKGLFSNHPFLGAMIYVSFRKGHIFDMLNIVWFFSGSSTEDDDSKFQKSDYGLDFSGLVLLESRGIIHGHRRIFCNKGPSAANPSCCRRAGGEGRCAKSSHHRGELVTGW